MKEGLLFHVGNIALAVFWSFFVWINFSGFLATNKIALLLAAIDATIVTLLFVLRTRPRLSSSDPIANGVAFSATFFLLLLRPTASTDSFFIGTFLILCGLLLVIASLLSLGRSFGIVPALRDIKTAGPYKIVRHPMYSGHIIAGLGYVLANPSLWNACIVVLAIALLLFRIRLEEDFMNQDNSYLNYARTTKYRLIPFVY